MALISFLKSGLFSSFSFLTSSGSLLEILCAAVDAELPADAPADAPAALTGAADAFIGIGFASLGRAGAVASLQPFGSLGSGGGFFKAGGLGTLPLPDAPLGADAAGGGGGGAAFGAAFGAGA